MVAGDRPFPLLERRHRFADAEQEIVGAQLSEERESLLEVGAERGIRVERAQIAREAAVLAVEREHRARVLDRRSDPLARAHDAGVARDAVNVEVVEQRDALRVEALEQPLVGRPLRLDDGPLQSGLEDGARHHGEIVGERLWIDLPRDRHAAPRCRYGLVWWVSSIVVLSLAPVSITTFWSLSVPTWNCATSLSPDETFIFSLPAGS